MAGISTSIEELMQIVGEQTVEIMLLRKQVRELQKEKEEREKKACECDKTQDCKDN